MKQCSFFPIHELTYPTKANGPIRMDKVASDVSTGLSSEYGETFFFYKWDNIAPRALPAFKRFVEEHSNRALHGWKHPGDVRPRTVVLSDLMVLESTGYSQNWADCRYEVTLVAFIIGGSQEDAPPQSQ